MSPRTGRPTDARKEFALKVRVDVVEQLRKWRPDISNIYNYLLVCMLRAVDEENCAADEVMLYYKETKV